MPNCDESTLERQVFEQIRRFSQECRKRPKMILIFDDFGRLCDVKIEISIKNNRK